MQPIKFTFTSILIVSAQLSFGQVDSARKIVEKGEQGEKKMQKEM
jgi:hypothetical protein